MRAVRQTRYVVALAVSSSFAALCALGVTGCHDSAGSSAPDDAFVAADGDGGDEVADTESPGDAPDGDERDGVDALAVDAPSDAPALKRIFLMHLESPKPPHTQPYSVAGYYDKVAILRCQWGPCFVDMIAGTVRWDIVTNSEYPGEGRFPGKLVDKHGCCMGMSLHDKKLIVLNDGTEEPFPGNTLVYSLTTVPAGDFEKVYDSAGDWGGDMGTQLADPNGFTWRLGTENATFTPTFRVDHYLYRSDFP